MTSRELEGVLDDLEKLAGQDRERALDQGGLGAETRVMCAERAERLEKLREELPLLVASAARHALTAAGTPVGRLVELSPAPPLTEGQRQGLAIAAGREEES